MIKLVDFYADWCYPCIIMKPVIEELKKELLGKVRVETVNVDENQDLARKFQIFSIPTYVVLKDDHEEERLIGATGKDKLLQLVQRHL